MALAVVAAVAIFAPSSPQKRMPETASLLAPPSSPANYATGYENNKNRPKHKASHFSSIWIAISLVWTVLGRVSDCNPWRIKATEDLHHNSGAPLFIWTDKE